MNENENENLQPIQKLTPFTKMVMSIGTLPSSFYASMSYYESMVWLYEYLKNQVIPTVNNNAEAVEELQEKYIEFSEDITEEVGDFKEYINGKVDELESYMNNYFTNLDVQQEINNKLDAMATDGTLTNLIKAYVDPIYEAYEQEINTLNTNFQTQVNTNLNTMNNKINNAISGSPKGVYATVSDLETANPSHDYIYLVTADGKWYYYSTSLSAWTAGGTYQGTSDENLIEYFETLLGNEFTEFTTSSTSSSTKNIMLPLSVNANQYITVYLANANNKVSYYNLNLFTESNQYISLTPGTPYYSQANQLFIYKVPDTYESYTKMQFYITATDTIADEEIAPKIRVLGELTHNEIINEVYNTRTMDVYENLQYDNVFNYVGNETFEARSIDASNGYILGGNYHSDYIPIKPNTTYYQKGGYTGGNYAVYDINKIFIPNGITITPSSNNTKGTFTTPSNAYFYRFTSLTEHPSDDWYLSEVGDRYRPYGLYATNFINNLDSSLLNKKVLIIGDSISTDSYASYKKWVSYLIDDEFFKDENTTNNSYHATGFVATYKEGDVVVQDNFYNRLQNVANKNTYDYVITFGGINDFIQNVAWSDFTTNVDNYMNYLVNNFTQARLVVLSPLRTYNTYANSVGKYQTEYAEYIRNKAKELCIPVLNLTEESGFCPFNNTFKDMWTWYNPDPSSPYYEVRDGVHPNTDYQKKFLAPMIKKFLMYLMK